MRWRHWRSAFRSSLSASPTTRRTCIAGRYHAPDADLGLECIVTLCLAGPEAEKQFCGPISDDSDRIDYQMAENYLSRQFSPLQIASEFKRLPMPPVVWSRHLGHSAPHSRARRRVAAAWHVEWR